MNIHKKIMTALAVLGLTACNMFEPVSRNTPLDAPGLGTPEQAVTAVDYKVRALNFRVPDDLQVSEADGYYPFADIVWRGDPIGDRGKQITDIFEEAASRALLVDPGRVPAIANLQLVRFHGVTERTRFSFGGVYNIVFDVVMTDPATGEVLAPSRRIEANLDAPGGMAAILLDQQGQTEKVRITDFLTLVLMRELSGTPRADV